MNKTNPNSKMDRAADAQIMQTNEHKCITSFDSDWAKQNSFQFLSQLKKQCENY